MFKAVIFDLDGVITDTAELHFKAWKNLANQLNITLTEEFNENLKGVDRMTSLERILALGKQENNFTQEEKSNMATEKNNLYVKLIGELTPKDILPGIATLLKQLKENNIKIGLASASKNAPAILDYLDITDYFDTIVDPSTLKNGKPDPEIFIKAAEQLKTPISACIGVEDAYSGIQAINDAKMFSVGIGDEETLAQANVVLPNTSELTYEELVKVWK